MSLEPDITHHTRIPESLRLLLAHYRRQLWRMRIAEALLAGLAGLLISWLMVALLDRLMVTPGWLRLLLLLLGSSLFALFVPLWLRRWIWGHREDRALARLIAMRHPHLGDRLLGILELQDQEASVQQTSPALRLAAMQSVAREMEQLTLSDSLPPSWLKKIGALVAVTIVVLMAAAIFVPRALQNSLMRWALPWSDQPRYTFTSIEKLPQPWIVPLGETQQLRVRLSPLSEWQPQVATLNLPQGPTLRATLQGREYVFTLPPQQRSTTLRLQVGDLQQDIALNAVGRPSLNAAQAIVTFPDYLQLASQVIDLSDGNVSVLSEATLQLQLQSNRPLASARIGPAQALDGNPALEESPLPEATVMTIAHDRAVSPALMMRHEPLTVPMQWTDTLGLDSQQDFQLRIDPISDQAPTCELLSQERQRVMLADETIEITLTCEDDYGVRDWGLVWQGEPDPRAANSLAQGELPLASSSARSEKKRSRVLNFCPQAQGIGPQKLLLRSYATDWRPERPRHFSEPITLHILSREDHAQWLGQLFDRTIGELEDSARHETSAFEENQRLQRLSDDELQQPANQLKLQAQQQLEAENRQHLSDLHQRTEQLLKDALRNGQIDPATLQRLSETMQSLHELSQQDLPQIERQLSEAQQNNNTPEQSKKDLNSAVEEQQRALKKMQETLKRAREANQSLEASTFINRLKKAASQQEQIAQKLMTQFEQSLGLPLNRVDPAVLTQLHAAEAQQAGNSADVRWLQEDLGHFFTRTNKEIYQKILTAMTDAKTDPGLESVRDLVRSNLGSRATQASKHWAELLRQWAGMLESSASGPAAGQGGGNGASNPEDEDFEFMLRVMKLIQQEQDLRSRTRALEDFKRSFAPAS